jgi:hypothetical protein
MLYLKNKYGRVIELEVCGSHDDIQISEAYYLDDPEEEVLESDLEYIYDNYGDDLYMKIVDNQISTADFYMDSLKDN